MVVRHLIFALMCLWSASSSAHQPSDSYLELTLSSDGVNGHWQIALRDLVTQVDMDRDGDAQLSWDELNSALPMLSLQAQTWLSFSRGNTSCEPVQIEDLLVNDRNDGRFAWLSISADCPISSSENVSLDYSFLHLADPTHRGILTLQTGSITHSAVLIPGAGPRAFSLSQPSYWTTAGDYLWQGVWHIWIGLDHILFLLALLLPAVLVHDKGRWHPAPDLRGSVRDVVGVVTAFTVAHSITLTLAMLGVVTVPIKPIEIAIAASVAIAALNNLFPLFGHKRWVFAFLFGLIHGFGFASALSDLGLPDTMRLLSLLSFNVGVELGQLAIVLVFIPIAFALRRSALYNPGIRVAGSLSVTLVAVYWVIQRAL